MITDVIKILIPSAAAFVIGIAITPVVSDFLYKHKMWKPKGVRTAIDGSAATISAQLHNDEERKTPRMGGIVVWGSVIITTALFYLLSLMFPGDATGKLSFLSRSQTWLPLSVMLVGAAAGLLDDILMVMPSGGGLALRYRLIIVVILSTIVGWWFYVKLGVIAINIPFAAPLFLGVLVIPFFVLISLALFASGVIDGIDGLSGGVFASVFAAYAIIAFMQHQLDLAAFCATVVGGLLAFLWFNIPPARFYMSDTGTVALTLALGVVAFLTDSLGGGVGVAVLPVIGFLLVVTVLSNIIQVLSKRMFGRKVLRVAPLHHHFEAIGWPGYKVVMRYWVLSVVFAFLGVILALSSIQP